MSYQVNQWVMFGNLLDPAITRITAILSDNTIMTDIATRPVSISDIQTFDINKCKYNQTSRLPPVGSDLGPTLGKMTASKHRRYTLLLKQKPEYPRIIQWCGTCC